MSFNEKYAKEEKKTFTPPQGVQSAAKKALKWIEEGHAGSGFTSVGHGRATQLANGEAVSLSTIKRMHSFFSRHRVDKQGKDWNKPSPGKVAWYAWGGDAGASWAAGIAGKNDGKKKEASAAEVLGLLTPAAIVAQPFIMDKINKRNDKKSKQEEEPSTEHTCDVGDHKVHEDVRCVTPDCEHKGKSWESDGHQDWDHDYACSEHFTKGTTAGIAREEESSYDGRYSNEKTAILQHLFDQGMQAIQHGGDFLMQHGHQLLKDMAHPVTQYFTGDPTHLHHLQQTADQLKGIEPNGGMGRTIADQNLQYYTEQNTGNHLNGVGLAADAAAVAAPFGIKKMIEKRQSSTFTYNSKNSSFAGEKSKFTYYEKPEAISTYSGPSLSQCGRCGIDINKSGKLFTNRNFGRVCPDCKDVLTAKPEEE